MAEDLGLDATEVLAAMNGDAVTEILQANHALAERLRITGTPTFVMGDGDDEGELLRGYLPLDAMQATVAQMRG